VTFVDHSATKKERTNESDNINREDNIDGNDNIDSVEQKLQKQVRILK
jgi:hypothetical protein